ncbi:MAG: extracellular solute-binding protein [Acholeplasma sp.]|nr:extracellular solute-binding protein [Acholeplasma sp.]
MKKIQVLIMVLLLSLFVSSCSKKSNGIVIWHDKEAAVINILKEYLNKEIPDVEVEFLRRESLTDNLKLVGNSESAAPDMYIFAHDKIGLFSELGILEPITSFISKDKLDSDYVKLTVDAATYKNNIYQLPIYYETVLFMYNKDRMSESEVPKTTEELYTYMKNNTDSRRYGFVEQHSSAYYSAGWIHGFNGSILDGSGKPTLDNESTIKALEYHKKFLEYMPKGQAEYATVNTMFYEKKANSIIGGPWIVPLAKENGIDLGFASMPIVDETNLPISPFAGVQGVHVLKIAAKNPDKKAKIQSIIDVFASSDMGIDLALETGSAPAQSAAYEKEEIINNELVMAMKEAAEKAIPMPNLPEMDIMWVTAANMLVAININGKDVKEAVKEAQKESQDLIDAMK